MFKVESTSTEEFKKACSTLVEILTHGKMKVSFAGETAMCHYNKKSGKPERMTLPNIDIGASDELKSVMRGYLDHEVGHLLFTDFAPVNEELNKLSAKEQNNVLSLFNIVEDARIEQSMREKYEGSKINLDFTETEMFADRDFADLAFSKEEPCVAILNGLVVKCRAIRGDALAEKIIAGQKDYYKPCEEFLAKHPDIRDLVKNARNSVEVLSTAKEIYKHLVDEHGEDAMPNADNMCETVIRVGDPNDDSDGQSTSSVSSSESEESENQDREGVGNKSEKEDEKEQNETEKEDKESKSEMSLPKDLFGDMLKKLIEKKYKNEVLQGDLDKLVGLPPITRDLDKFDRLLEKDEFKLFKDINGVILERNCLRFQEEIGLNSSQLEKHFERYLNSQSHSLWEYGQTKGKLYGAGLVKLRTGNEKIFRKKIVNKTKDVAVSLVVDCSGSMAGEKFEKAIQSAYIFSKALARVGIAHEVVGFTTRELPDEYDDALKDMFANWRKFQNNEEHGVIYGRIESLYLPVFKDFNDRFDHQILEVMARAYACDNFVGLFDNDDADSLLMIAERLKAQPQSRKVMFVFSDGIPYYMNYSAHQLGVEELKAAIKKIEDSGIEIFGVGIKSKAVQLFYQHHAVVYNLNDLTTTLLTELKQFLTKK